MSTHTSTNHAAHAVKPQDLPPITSAVVPIVIGCLLGAGAVLLGVLAFQH